jgi:endonuclease/exonuclease/phosphatase family metal-dependent hydrolase
MKAFFAALALLSTISAQALTIGAYNIRNFDYDERYRIRTDKVELHAIIKNLNIDVLSVEEIGNTGEWDKFVQTKLPGYGTEISRCGGRGGQHLGFLYNKNTVELLSFNEDLSISDPGLPGTCDGSSRPLAIGLFKIKATGQKFYGMTAHLKAGSNADAANKRLKQLEIIKANIQDLKTKTGVQDYFFAGDLNTTTYLQKGTDYSNLNKLAQSLGMSVLTSNIKCSAYYWGGTDDGIESPTLLDHIVATQGINGKRKAITSVQAHAHCQRVSCREVSEKELGISYKTVSDHCPVTAVFQ